MIQDGLRRSLEWVLDFDLAGAKADVARIRAESPRDTPEQLAETVCDEGGWAAAFSSAAAGLVGNPLLAGAASLADAVVTLRTHVETAARVALCYDADHFERPYARDELLVPILGAKAAATVLPAPEGTTALVAATGLQQSVVRRSLSVAGPMWRPLGMAALQALTPAKGLLAKSIPLLGGVLSGWWGRRDAVRIGERIRAYFAGRPLPAEHE